MPSALQDLLSSHHMCDVECIHGLEGDIPKIERAQSKL